MKLTTGILCCGIAIFLTFSGFVQNEADAKTLAFALSSNDSQAPEHGGKIESKYDGFSHETIVTLNKMRITCGSMKGNFKDACVSFLAALHCPGIQLDHVRYARLQIIFQTKDWDGRHPLDQRQLSVVADGETMRLGQMKLVGQNVDTTMTEVLEVSIPYKVFTKIALAQIVEMKVGNTAFELQEKNLAALRDLNNRVKY